MTMAEKHAWGSLIALGSVYYFFQMRLLDGWGVADVSSEHLFWTYILVIVFSIVAEGTIAAFFADKKTGNIEKDERDYMIEARANSAEHLFLIVSINIMLFHIIADAAFDNHLFPSINLSDLPSLVFVLFSLLFVGEGIKRIFTIYYYRAGEAG